MPFTCAVLLGFFALETSATRLNLTFSASLHLLLSQRRFRALPSAPKATCAGYQGAQWSLGASLPLSCQLSAPDLSTGLAMLLTEEPWKESIHEWSKERSSPLDPLFRKLGHFCTLWDTHSRCCLSHTGDGYHRQATG